MMGHPGDMNTSERRRWIEQQQKTLERENRRDRAEIRAAWLKIGAGLLAWLVIMAGGLYAAFADAAECGDGFRLEVGIGAHPRGLDGPEYTTLNPLGIIAARYQLGRFAFTFDHYSSMEGFPRVFDSPHEYGYGANVAGVRWRIW